MLLDTLLGFFFPLKASDCSFLNALAPLNDNAQTSRCSSLAVNNLCATPPTQDRSWRPAHTCLTMASSPVKQFLVTYLMPERCYEEMFVKLHLHAPCVKFVLTKAAGFWMLLDTLLAQVAQLLKILWRGSAEGLSLASVILQLYAFSCPVVYAVANNFPLFAWAERTFTLAQTAAIVFLILHYRGETLKGLLFVLAYSGVMFLLAHYAAAKVISVMQSSSVAAVIASKALQAGANYCNGHTGQLSSVSLFLTWAGSLGVTFHSLQETGSSVVTLSHTLSACLSCALLAQVLCYRSQTSTKAKSE